jgi:hypothetical protein
MDPCPEDAEVAEKAAGVPRLRWPALRAGAAGHANQEYKRCPAVDWLVFPDSRALSRAKRGTANVA